MLEIYNTIMFIFFGFVFLALVIQVILENNIRYKKIKIFDSSIKVKKSSFSDESIRNEIIKIWIFWLNKYPKTLTLTFKAIENLKIEFTEIKIRVNNKEVIGYSKDLKKVEIFIDSKYKDISETALSDQLLRIFSSVNNLEYNPSLIREYEKARLSMKH